MLQFIFLRS